MSKFTNKASLLLASFSLTSAQYVTTDLDGNLAAANDEIPFEEVSTSGPVNVINWSNRNRGTRRALYSLRFSHVPADTSEPSWIGNLIGDEKQNIVETNFGQDNCITAVATYGDVLVERIDV